MPTCSGSLNDGQAYALDLFCTFRWAAVPQLELLQSQQQMEQEMEKKEAYVKEK